MSNLTDELVRKDYLNFTLDAKFQSLFIKISAMMIGGFGLTIGILSFLLKLH